MKSLSRIVIVLAAAIAPVSAQWFNFPTAGIPRKADGKPDLAAPVPKTADGKPDISGLWQPQGGYVANITKDLKPGEVSFQPWAEKLAAYRKETHGKDDPTGFCIPGGVPRSNLVGGYPFKIFQVPGEVVIMYEAVHTFRQIFTDGRALPKDPNPTWLGYSVGRWDGDTFVVETSGFNDKGWLDNQGTPSTDALHVTERFHRRDFGNMEVRITIEDSKTYTKPWTMTLPLALSADNELLEYVCAENNKDIEHLVGK